MKKSSNLNIVATAPIPTEFGIFDMHVFHWTDKTNNNNQSFGLSKDHIIMSMGDLKNQENVLVRIHSECITSEIFGSLKCDCRKQLLAAQKEISNAGKGVIIYLRQEGRGIGLINKIKAYNLQSNGHDTVDANRLLGLPDDLRSYDCVAEIIKYFEISSIQLLTNNPIKLKEVKSQGIKTKRRDIICQTNPYSISYLQSKKQRMGHIIPKSFFS